MSDELTGYFVPLLAVAIIAYVTASLFTEVVSMATDAILQVNKSYFHHNFFCLF